MLRAVDFRPTEYGAEVSRILAIDGNGTRQMPLAGSNGFSSAGRDALKNFRARDLLPGARSPEGALSGLYLYFSCLDEGHKVAQDLDTEDGSFWHGIMHRREPDAGNAAYWFRRVGRHPVFPQLWEEARRLRFDTGSEWDPFQFIEFCENARARPGSDEEHIALEVQLLEWQILFDYCARPVKR